MPMDVYRTEDGSYHVEADLPGVALDSVEVTVEHSTLTIRAERSPHYGEGEQVIVAERPQGSFTRQLSLGEGVDSENLTADYADGVLHVTIPVSPKTQARRVEITHASGGKRTISGAQSKRVRRPPAAAAAQHPPDHACASRHGTRAGAGLGPAENDQLAATRRRRMVPLSPEMSGMARQVIQWPQAYGHCRETDVGRWTMAVGGIRAEQMNPADVAWLHMDRPANLMVVNTVLWFDAPVD